MSVQFRAVCLCGVECWWQATFVGSNVHGAQQVHFRIDCPNPSCEPPALKETA